MTSTKLKYISPLLALGIFLLAAWSLHRTVGKYPVDELLSQLTAFPSAVIARAVALTCLSYLFLGFYDRLALSYLGRRLSQARISLASFTSYAFSRNVGFTLLTGGSVRYRFYSTWGLRPGEIALLIAFAALSFTLGLAVIGGGILLFLPGPGAEVPQLPKALLRPAGLLLLLAVAGYFLLVVTRRRPLWMRWPLPLPDLRHAVGQALVGATDWMLTASVLYVLLPASAGVSLPLFLQIYLLAELAAIVSHVPGGLGVFESVLLLLIPGVPVPVLFGILLVYRAIYYLLPFVLSLLLLAGFELRLRWGRRGHRL